MIARKKRLNNSHLFGLFDTSFFWGGCYVHPSPLYIDLRMYECAFLHEYIKIVQDCISGNFHFLRF